MEIYCEQNEFTHIRIATESIFEGNTKYDDCVLVFGYNIINGGIKTIRKIYPNKKVIVYQLEQLYRGNRWVTRTNMEFLKEADFVWDYDEQNISFLKQEFNITGKFVPILYSPELTTMPIQRPEKHDIDVLFYGSLNEHRTAIVDKIKAAMPNANIIATDKLWGDELDDHIHRAKIVLNIHYYPTNRQEQARMFYLMANHKCIVSERSTINYYGNGIVECNGDNMAEICNNLLVTGDWYKYAKRSLQKLIISNVNLIKGS
jgi:hypothetical protein